eukprot:CAMPEP_0176356256 /NCGR_PEP_ID=MMETSP0126-20121128/13890_1 /TAXON_ID=141414 ORGANISM="Strombidinopsis acuminatum, Strain SPMC142" /NCGR_SAMPLE_ID=MMETSP0126 /ASSEMBLY_ACC=CAM_ASM_000229 /LENGTH=70 /DNA_ID=CAMNT_0017709279 /DNA_START=1110 /DNA_END=1322 /DNA_ORIENTATION=-
MDQDCIEEEFDIKKELSSQVLHKVHGDHTSSLPADALLLASSKRTKNEIWQLDGRVLAVQAHPEFNAYYI